MFATNQDGSVTMVTQIHYAGAAPDFAWVVPLAEVPAADSLAVFPQLALTALDAATGPQFRWRPLWATPEPPSAAKQAETMKIATVPGRRSSSTGVSGGPTRAQRSSPEPGELAVTDPSPRAAVVALLAGTLSRAVALGDEVAARVVHETIGRLLGLPVRPRSRRLESASVARTREGYAGGHRGLG
ncbi:hypothetical protein [Sorangium sp. So ce1078]|uniref:hypothetical protein n=1 Tax=Sorangium sp. So ce1078 TaxID=3133329 RepID=UPI003F5FA54A